MKWNIKRVNPLKVVAYKKRLGVTELMAKVLINRNIDIDTAAKELHDPIALIEDPCEIKGAIETATAISNEFGKSKKFFVFADYDVDGIASGYIMTDFLRSIGENAEVYYPQRSEGYGLSIDFVNLAVMNPDIVVITVDNGITKIKEVAALKEAGIPVIVTDHHEPQEELPDCPLCDAWVEGNTAGRHLCGAGIAWKICMILEDMQSKEGLIEKYLPHVALATVTDVMPMTPENIALVNLGLQAINDKESRIFNLLMELLDIKKMTAEDFGWKIGPKINACGRMERIDLAGELFFMEEADKDAIKDQIRDIIETDDERVKYTKHAQKAIEKLDYSNDSICLFNATEYPHGIAGIIAGKIANRFNKPAFVYTEHDGICTASARSAGGIDLGVLLADEVQDGHILSWGGHAEACGCAWGYEKMPDFLHSMNSKIASMMADGSINAVEPELTVDTEISFADLSDKAMNDIQAIAYDKTSCTEPIFCLKDVKVKATQPYSNKDHLVLRCTDKQGKELTLVLWGGYPQYESVGKPAVMDIAGTLSMVGFPDRTTKRKATDITIKIIDMKPAA